MRKILLALCMMLAALAPAEAIYPFANANSSYAAPATGGCTQATTFLARTSGLSGTQSGAYTTMICGMVSDGTWSLLDTLWVFATNTTTTANLNLVSTSYTLSPVASPTFTANTGYTGTGSSYFNSGVNLASLTHYSLNSATFGSCDLSASGSTSNQTLLGANDGSAASRMFHNSTIVGVSLNGSSLGGPTAAIPGSYIGTVVAAGNSNIYVNGSLVLNNNPTPSGVSTGQNVYIMAYNNVGLANTFMVDTMPYAFIGSGMTATQALAMYNRLHTFLSTVGAPSGC